MKKICVFFIIFIILITKNVYADDNLDEVYEYDNIPEIIETVSNIEDIPKINSRAAVVYDRNSKEVLFGKEENSKRKMASTTKIMTSIIIIENYNLKDIVEVSKKAAGTGGSRLGLKSGDKITVNDLLYGLMLCSGNDSAVALAEYAGNSLDGFAELMNKKAESLELNNTHFITPHGLDNDEHFTTAMDLAKLTDYALKNDMFAKIVGTQNYTVTINGNAKNINNTNELLGNLDGVYGVKTGFTNGANRCLVTAIKRDNLDIITIVLGADSKKLRTQDSIKLINYAFDNYEDINVNEIIDKSFNEWKEQNKNGFIIEKGVSNNIEIKLDKIQNYFISVRKNQNKNIDISYIVVNKFEAPLKKNSIVGKLILKVEGINKLEVNILNVNGIKKKNINNYMLELFEKMVS